MRCDLGSRQRRFRALRRGPRRARRAGSGGPAAGGDRIAVRGDAGAGDQARRDPVPGLHAVLPGVGRPWLAGARRVRRRGRVLAQPRWRRDPADPRLPAGLTLPEPGEAAALAAWRRFRRAHLAGYADERDRPDLDHTSRMSPYLKLGSIHPRTILADLGPGDSAYRREIAWREFYAAVLHFWPGSAREYFQPALAKLPYENGAAADEAFAAWVAGPHRLPDRGRRDAPAAGGGLDAQPGAHDRGLVPGQGPAHRVDARRPALHAPPGGRRPGQQPARLAVDGGHGHGRGAVLPDLQPGHPGRQVRPGRRLRPPLGARAGGAARPRDSRALAARGRRPGGLPAAARGPRSRARRVPGALQRAARPTVTRPIVEMVAAGNLMRLARMLRDAGGIPAHGNQRSEWDAGCRFDFENPEYR